MKFEGTDLFPVLAVRVRRSRRRSGGSIMSVTKILVTAPKLEIVIAFSIQIGFQRFENHTKAFKESLTVRKPRDSYENRNLEINSLPR